MGRPFHTRFRENFRDFRYKNGKSKFAHLIDNSTPLHPWKTSWKFYTLLKKGNKKSSTYTT